MTAQILKGSVLAQTYKQTLATELKKSHYPRMPGLAVILIGHDPASKIYVKHKQHACEQVGIHSFLFNFSALCTEAELLGQLSLLNENPEIDGILIQLPLPPHLNSDRILEHILPSKDVDGFHPLNVGKLVQNRAGLKPCTPFGVMHLLAQTQVDLPGKHAVVIGMSQIVGRPMALELLSAGCTVTVCHSRTENLASHVIQADILVSATGHPHLVQGDWIKPGAIVIDVGMHRTAHETLMGDVDFEAAKKRASWITPVPGGVGPMTVAMLLYNTFQAYCAHLGMENMLSSHIY